MKKRVLTALTHHIIHISPYDTLAIITIQLPEEGFCVKGEFTDSAVMLLAPVAGFSLFLAVEESSMTVFDLAKSVTTAPSTG